MKTTAKPSDMLVLCFIAIVGLLAAYICFGILKSEADGKYQGYSVGGAIAGALVSWGVLSSIFLKLRKSTSEDEERQRKARSEDDDRQNKQFLILKQLSENDQVAAAQRKNELDELHKQVADLQSKLIRSAPKPSGFTIEVAERESIVLARPEYWAPKGGTIFELELPEYSENKDGSPAEKGMAREDKFPATFRCYFLPMEKGKDNPVAREKYYNAELATVKKACEGDNPYVASYSMEKIRLGGEASSIEGLKIIAQQYLRIEIGPSVDTGAVIRTWVMISRDEFAGRIWEINPPVVNVGRPQMITIRGYFIRKDAVCYVSERKVESTTVWMNNIGAFEIHAWLTEEELMVPGQLRISILNPDTDGFRSLPVPLTVMDMGGVKGGVPFEKPAPQDTVANPPPKDSTPPGKVSETDTTLLKATASATAPMQGVFFQQVSRMRVFCYHEQLKKIYFFDFWDDVGDFVTSSDEFNQIVASTRFLC